MRTLLSKISILVKNADKSRIKRLHGEKQVFKGLISFETQNIPKKKKEMQNVNSNGHVPKAIFVGHSQGI